MTNEERKRMTALKAELDQVVADSIRDSRELVRLRAIEALARKVLSAPAILGGGPDRVELARLLGEPHAVADPNQRYYLISLSRSKVARCAVFWGPDARGYSRRLNDAGDFTDRQIAKYADGDSLAIPCGAVHVVATNNMVSSEHLDDLKAKAVKPGSTS